MAKKVGDKKVTNKDKVNQQKAQDKAAQKAPKKVVPKKKWFDEYLNLTNMIAQIKFIIQSSWM